MTEPLIPIGSAPAGAPDAEPPKDRRRLVVAGAALAAVAAAAGGLLLLGGSDEPLPDGPSRPAGSVVAAPPATLVTEPVAALPPPSEVQLGRNPFRALYVQPVAAPADEVAAPPAPVATAPTTPPSTSTGGTAPTAPAPAPVAPAPVGPAPVGPAPAQVPAVTAPPADVLHEVVLTRVEGGDGERRAVFSVDGTDQAVAVGATFGPSGQLLLISLQQGPRVDQWTAVLQVGDGDPFDVVTGDPAYVP